MAIGDPSPRELKLLANIAEWEKGLADPGLLLEEEPDLEVEIMTENLTAPPRCPNHPAEPQIVMGGKRAGQFMGACKVCMVERKARSAATQNSRSRGGKGGKEGMTPAVARDFGAPPAPVCQITPAVPPINVQPAEAPITPANGLTLLLDFTDYPDIWKKLQADALMRVRTPAMQAIYFIKVNDA